MNDTEVSMLSTRRTRTLVPWIAVASILLAMSPRGGAAQSASVPAVLASSWRLEGGSARALRTIDAAFAPSISALPELLQGFARDRIHSSMGPPRDVVVALDGARVRVTLTGEARNVVVSGALNTAATTSGVDDGTRVTPRLSGGWLELFYEGEGAELRQLFSTEADGSHMHLDYTVVNERLAGPVRYRLDYAPAR